MMTLENKTQGEMLAEQLFYKPKNGYDVFDDKEIDEAYAYCEGYKAFIDECKTERECVEKAVRLAKEKGFTLFDRNKSYNPGDKVYTVNSGKAVFFFVFGKKTVDNGIYIAGSHIDSPRLDLKPRPLYQDHDLALFKTHYYGGIKKYQWTTIPLALHGVVCKPDGKTVKICVGEDENDPVFVLTDLLPHLAQEQVTAKMSEAIKGENMNILVGSRPFKDDKASEKVKLAVLSALYEKYGITEKDFLSAELEVVPAAKARDVGLDRSMIGAYGHDDRVCSYPALTALLDTEAPEHGIMTMLLDKEETGSDGLTGMKSHFMQYFFEEIAENQGVSYRDMYRHSVCFSADVTAALDPNYPEVMDIRNCSFLNCGVSVGKYHGARGKSSTSDASAEVMAFVADTLDDKALWQTGELGKVDLGGGGTIAMYVAQLGIPTVDIGVPMLCMHAPWELVAKLDVYSAYKAFYSLFNR